MNGRDTWIRHKNKPNVTKTFKAKQSRMDEQEREIQFLIQENSKLLKKIADMEEQMERERGPRGQASAPSSRPIGDFDFSTYNGTKL